MKKCVFAGSFDPITNGHLYVIEKCAMMFDEVVVAIGINENKKYSFHLEDRVEFIRLSVSRLSNVIVKTFDNMLADFMRVEDAVYLVRGIRDAKDIAFETKNFEITSKLNPDVEMMFFNCPKELQNVSSTQVKKHLDEKKSIKKLVPKQIVELVEAKYRKK